MPHDTLETRRADALAKWLHERGGFAVDEQRHGSALRAAFEAGWRAAMSDAVHQAASRLRERGR